SPVTALRIHDYPVLGPVFETDQAGDRALLTIVTATPHALLCYVGPVLEQLTGGHYVSAAHRSSLADSRPRPSVSFSFEPRPGTALTPVTGLGARPNIQHSARYALAAR